MESNTLYYTFSTIAQVLGAVVAILAAFTHFRIQNLRDLLIGHGKSVFTRWGQPGYEFPPEKESLYRLRLRDAIDRRFIPEIKKIIHKLAEIEEAQGIISQDKPGGLQYLYHHRFLKTENRITKLRSTTRNVIIVSFITIVVSVSSLAVTDVILSCRWPWLAYLVLWFNVAWFIISLILAWNLVRRGLSEDSE